MFTDSGDHLKNMQCTSYSRGHHRAYKRRPMYNVPHRELMVKFLELQQQLGELNKMVEREQIQSQVQRNIIKGLQRQLKSATRQTETQRALKEKSIVREEEIRRELVRLIKVHCEESSSPEPNNRQRRRRKKKQRVEQEKMMSHMEQATPQDMCKRLSEVPQVQFNQKSEFVRKQADGFLDTETNQLNFKEREEQSRTRSIEELSLKFKQNCSLKVRISIQPKDE